MPKSNNNNNNTQKVKSSRTTNNNNHNNRKSTSPNNNNNTKVVLPNKTLIIPTETIITTNKQQKIILKYGFFPSNSFVDHFDRRLSKPIFFFDRFHPYLDHLLLIPGTWFGLPTPTWGFASTTLVWYHEHMSDLMSFRSTSFLLLLIIIPLIIYTVVFITGIGNPTTIYNPKGQLPIPLVLWSTIWYITNTHRGPGAFFAVAWSMAQATTHLVKITAGRVRPIKSFDVRHVKREFKELRFMFSEGQTVLESFPSADAAGAGSLAGTLYLMNIWWGWILLLSATSMFSRLYFHAHHLLDVIVGVLIGWSCSMVLYYYVCNSRLDVLSAKEVLISALTFIFIHVGSKPLRPKLPEEFKSLDVTRYKDF
jgi:membrane-associated phospholipid phosphatase